MSDNEEIIHKRICLKAKKSNDLRNWMKYGCKNCKQKLKYAEKKYKEIDEISRHAKIDDEGSDIIRQEKADSMEIHDGIYHPLIGYIFRNEIKEREINNIKNESLKAKVMFFWKEEQNIVSDVWSRY